MTAVLLKLSQGEGLVAWQAVKVVFNPENPLEVRDAALRNEDYLTSHGVALDPRREWTVERTWGTR